MPLQGDSILHEDQPHSRAHFRSYVTSIAIAGAKSRYVASLTVWNGIVCSTHSRRKRVMSICWKLIQPVEMIITIVIITNCIQAKLFQKFLFHFFVSFSFFIIYLFIWTGVWTLGHFITELHTSPFPFILRQGYAKVGRLALNLQSPCLGFLSRWEYIHHHAQSVSGF